MINGGRQLSRDGTSRMNREVHVRFCEGLGVKFPGPTRHEQPIPSRPGWQLLPNLRTSRGKIATANSGPSPRMGLHGFLRSHAKHQLIKSTLVPLWTIFPNAAASQFVRRTHP
jgi:hypothetical protein